jgi:hypothetical protein
MALQAEVLKQIDAVLGQYRELRARSRYDDCSDQPAVSVTAVSTLMADTINRFAPRGSQYIDSLKSISMKFGVAYGRATPHIAGVLSALRSAYEAGYIQTVVELIHADVFTDFLEMAEYLLSEGYKDPAAVLIGSVLEEHLRQLCVKSEVAIIASGKTKKAEQLNTDLSGHGVYSKLDQKSVTAWLDLRNKAAHGKYNEYSKEQVTFLSESVRDFMTRVPA